MRVRTGFVDITPEGKLPLFGYAGRDGVFSDVESRIEVNAIGFESGDRDIYLVSVDSLFAGLLSEDLEKRLKTLHRSISVICVASHTHFAPSLDESKPRLGGMSRDYYNFVLSRCETLLRRLRAESGSEAAIGKSTADIATPLAVNRRDIRWQLGMKWPHLKFGAAMAPNFASERKFPITALHVSDDADQARRPLAIIWHWTCHPVAASDPDRLSANYPGAVRKKLRERYGDQLPVIFLQGFCGDVRPAVGVRKPTWREAMSGFPGPVFASITDAEYQAWNTKVADAALQTVVSEVGPALGGTEEITFDSIEIPVGDLMRGDASGMHLSLGLLQIGSVLSLSFASAEVLSGFEDLVRDILGRDCIPVGYWKDNFGYLPTDDDINRQGYEVDGFRWAFSLQGRYRGGVNETIASALKSLKAAASQNRLRRAS